MTASCAMPIQMHHVEAWTADPRGACRPNLPYLTTSSVFGSIPIGGVGKKSDFSSNVSFDTSPSTVRLFGSWVGRWFKTSRHPGTTGPPNPPKAETTERLWLLWEQDRGGSVLGDAVAFVNFRLATKGARGAGYHRYGGALVARRPTASSHESTAEDDVYPRKHQLKLRPRELPRARGEEGLVQRHDLGDVGDGVLGQTCESWRKPHVSWRVRPAEVTGEWNAHDGRDPAAVQGVSLHNHDRPSESRSGAGWVRELGPPDLALGNYQSLRSKMRRDAVETNESVGWPSLAQTRSMASVTRSGACRATYSARACL